MHIVWFVPLLEAALIFLIHHHLHNIQQNTVFIKNLYQNTLNEVLQYFKHSFIFLDKIYKLPKY